MIFLDIPGLSDQVLAQSAFCTMSVENIKPKVALDHIPFSSSKYLKGYPVHEISFLVFFLIPVIVLAFLYISMVRTIKQSTGSTTELRKHIHTSPEDSSLTPNNMRNQTIRMLSEHIYISYFLIIFSFFSCCGCSVFHLLGSFSHPETWLCVLQA